MSFAASDTMTPTLAPRATSSSPNANGWSNTARRRPREREHVVDAGDVVADDGELVAAEPRQAIARAQDPREAARRGREQLVAGLVAEAVVHDLEVVDVEQDEADPGVVGARGEGVLQPLDEHDAIRELGQRIVPGAVRKLGLDPSVLADVVRGADELFADAVARRPAGSRRPRPGGAAWSRPIRSRTRSSGTRAPRAAKARTWATSALAGTMLAEVAGRRRSPGRRVVAAQGPVGVVRVDEAEQVVAVDRDRERGMRQQVEQARVTGLRRPGNAGAVGRVRRARERRHRRLT